MGCFVLAGLALLMTAARSMAAAWVLAGVGMVFFVAIHLVGRSEIKQARRRVGQYFSGMWRGGETRKAGYAALERMARAESVDSVYSPSTER